MHGVFLIFFYIIRLRLMSEMQPFATDDLVIWASVGVSVMRRHNVAVTTLLYPLAKVSSERFYHF